MHIILRLCKIFHSKMCHLRPFNRIKHAFHLERHPFPYSIAVILHWKCFIRIEMVRGKVDRFSFIVERAVGARERDRVDGSVLANRVLGKRKTDNKRMQILKLKIDKLIINGAFCVSCYHFNAISLCVRERVWRSAPPQIIMLCCQCVRAEWLHLVIKIKLQLCNSIKLNCKVGTNGLSLRCVRPC